MPESRDGSDQPVPHGPLIATGRAADVFAHGDGLVLRRYRTDHDCVYEADVMRHVREHGYPVPEVTEAGGRDLVMERIDGTTMLDDFSKHPWRLRTHAATIADLMKRLHAIAAPEWLKAKHPTGDVFVHLDLHPDNVMLSSKGPVVIDWSNAGRGNGDAEVADLWLIMSCASVPGSAVERTIIGAGRKLFVRSFLKHFDLTGVRKQLAQALEFRSRDRNMSEAELTAMGDLVSRFGT